MPLTPTQRAKLQLSRTEGVGPLTYRRLLGRFASAQEALAELPSLAKTAGRAITQVFPAEEAEREAAALAKLAGQFLFLDEPAYPLRLAQLPDAPPVLAVLGDPSILSGRLVGIVGARNASANGQRVAEALAADLASQGVAVASGLARGIDSAAHNGAMHTGRTVAAVAGGLDQPYPPENAGLQARIAENGAVVTEAPLGTAPQSRHFPKRNRIIAGLSLGLVVVEAALRSGSLITARLALDAGREVFAVPGSPLDPRCLGSNDLIRQGAHLTEGAADVLAHLSPEAAPRPLLPGFAEPPPDTPALHDLTQVSAEIAGLLGASPTEIDDLIRRSQFPASAVMAVLSQLELALRVEILPGNRAMLLAQGPATGR